MGMMMFLEITHKDNYFHFSNKKKIDRFVRFAYTHIGTFKKKVSNINFHLGLFSCLSSLKAQSVRLIYFLKDSFNRFSLNDISDLAGFSAFFNNVK